MTSPSLARALTGLCDCFEVALMPNGAGVPQRPPRGAKRKTSRAQILDALRAHKTQHGELATQDTIAEALKVARVTIQRRYEGRWPNSVDDIPAS